MGKRVQHHLVAAEEGYEIGGEVQDEKYVPGNVYFHESAGKDHVDQKENVCQHGDNVAEPQPSDLVVFILVIIGVQGSDGFFVGLVELYYIICALGDEQQERCREGNDEMQPVFAPEK